METGLTTLTNSLLGFYDTFHVWINANVEQTNIIGKELLNWSIRQGYSWEITSNIENNSASSLFVKSYDSILDLSNILVKIPFSPFYMDENYVCCCFYNLSVDSRKNHYCHFRYSNKYSLHRYGI